MDLQKMKKRVVLCLITLTAFVLCACSSSSKKGDGEVKVEKGKYGITVMNQDGEVVDGAAVTLNGVTVTTGNNGYASFDEFVGTTTLMITKTGYNDYVNSAYTASGSAADMITIHAQSQQNYMLKKATYISGSTQVDLLNSAKQLNATSELVGFQIAVEVNKNAETVSEYQLHQVVTSESGRQDVTIAKTANGIFDGLNVSRFATGTGVYVKVIGKDGNSFSSSLNLEIIEGPNLDGEMKISLGDAISFHVNDDIPIIGGSDIEMSLPELPVEFEATENMVKVGINLNPEELDDEAWDDIEDTLSDASRKANTTAQDLRNIKEKIRNHSVLGTEKQPWRDAVRAPKFDDLEFGAMGYVEAVCGNDGRLAKGSGYICITMEGGVGFNWQTAVWIVPVDIDVEGKLSANLNAAIGYDFYENKLTGDASLGVEPELTLKAGVGMKNLSAGVYGKASLPFEIAIASTGSNPGLRKLELCGEVGVYADIAIWSYSKALLNGSLQIYPWQSSETLSYKQQKLYDLSEYSLAEPAAQKLAAFQTNTITTDNTNPTKIVTDAYSGAEVDSVSNGNDTILVYTQMNEDSSDADYGKTQLFVSKYDATTESFGEPKRVTDGTDYEYRPQLYQSGSDIYLVYQSNSSSSDLVENFDTLEDDAKIAVIEEYMRNMSLKVAKYDVSTESFVDLGVVSDANTYNYSYNFAVINECPTVVWMSNTSGDVFGTKDLNAINYASYQNGAWDKKTLKEDLSAVISTQVGVIKDSALIVYVKDEDKNFNTIDDRCVYVVDETGNSTMIGKGDIGDVNIDTLPGGTENVLYWNEAANIKYITGVGEEAQSLFAKSVNGLQGEYAFVSDTFYYIASEGDRSNIYRKQYRGQEEGWSEGVAVTTQDLWVRNVSLLSVGEDTMYVAQQEAYDMGNETLKTDIVSGKLGKRYDLVNEGVTYNPKNVQQINGVSAIEMKVAVRNDGTESVTPVVMVADADGTQLPVSTDLQVDTQSVECVTEVLNSGASKEISAWVVLPAALSAEAYQVKVLTLEELEQEDLEAELVTEEITEANTENNTSDIHLGYGDLALSVKQYHGGDYCSVIAVVENNGNVAQGGKVVITNPDAPTKELASATLENLQPGERQVVKKNVSEDWVKNGNGVLKVSVTNCDNDLYYGNNTTYTVATVSYGNYNITYNLNGGKNSSKNPSTYTTKDTITFAKPTRSGYSFEGWYTSSNCNAGSKIEKVYSGTAGDLTLYAKWKSTKTKKTTTLKGRVFRKGSLKYKIVSVKGTRKVCVYGVKSKKVKKVTIPAKVKYGKYKYKVTAIRAGAFKNCKKLKKITIKSKSLTKVGKNAFKGINKKCKIKVPKKSYKKYKKLLKKKGQSKKVKIVK